MIVTTVLQVVTEAALRSGVMGAIILGLLAIFRIRQARAQRTAWVLALVGALAMPLLVYWPVTLPVSVADVSRTMRGAKLGRSGLTISSPADGDADLREQWPATVVFTRGAGAIAADAGMQHTSNLPPTAERNRRWMVRGHLDALLAFARRWGLLLYATVAFMFLLRLSAGVILSLRLRDCSTRNTSAFAQHLDVRVSDRLTSPVTIGRTIVLPLESRHWDAETLRLVIAHESAHVAHSDFTVQCLATLHCAIFWFSPYAWWIRRKLAALGETLSDQAALGICGDRSRYAELLLHFAQAARQPAAAVPMARRSNLRRRVECLLNEHIYQESFTGLTRRTLILAACIVPVALLSSASLVRVHAAAQTSAPAQAASSSGSASASASSGDSSSRQGSSPGTGNAVLSDGASPQSNDAMPAPTSPVQAAPPAPESQPPSRREQTSQATMHVQIDKEDAGDVFALVDGDDRLIINQSAGTNLSTDDIAGKAKSPYIFYQRDGRQYVIQDPAILAQALQLYAPMKPLEEQQRRLAEQQRALGDQQRALAEETANIKVKVPDAAELTRQIAEATATMQKFEEQDLNREIDQAKLNALQGELSRLQGQLGRLQGEAGRQEGAVGTKEGDLGRKEGDLGRQEGELGREQGRLTRQMLQQLQPLIDQAIRGGKAKPVQ